MTTLQRKSKPKSPRKKATAILCADLHIRATVPVCRTDSFFSAMEKKLDFILSLSGKHNCPILVAGDLGDTPQWPNWLLEWCISKFKGHKIYVIPGQHDLPNHRIDLWEKSGIGVLHAAEVIEIIGILKTEEDKYVIGHFPPKFADKYSFCLVPFPYGTPIKELDWGKKYEKPKEPMIAMAHQMVLKTDPLWPGQHSSKAYQLLKKYPEYSVILTGDNHSPFTEKQGGRWLINPGSMMRTTVGQIDHKPRVYLWYAEGNIIEKIYLPIQAGDKVINQEHIQAAIKEREQRDKRIQAVVRRIREDVEIRLSFLENMEKYLTKHKTRTRVKEKIWEACEKDESNRTSA